MFFHEKDNIRPDSPNGSFYLEKLHIWESQGIHKQIFLLIHRANMFFIYLYKETYYMLPLDISRDIEKLIVCDMIKGEADE